MIEEPVRSAEVRVCGLGYGYYWLNGEPLSRDLFTAPVSDYRKTLWYNSYDLTNRLKEGVNVFAVICGNGWYNEYFRTSWSYDTAPWRDNPKFILELTVNGKTVLRSDDTWKCLSDSFVVYNQLRSGEHFDARLYDPRWTSAEYDDSGWGSAAADTKPPTGVFRLCPCEPIREFEEYEPVSMTSDGENGVIFDFGRNISGYLRLTVDQDEGGEIVIRYREQKDADGNLFDHMKHHYPETECQTDRLICPKGPFTWSPRFAYHGFQYAQIEGLKDPSPDSVRAVFVHHDISARGDFSCSDPFMNELFRIGQNAVMSNLFYMPTDCPTREKLGWCNDAQSSMEQFLTDFTSERIMEKWLQDIYDSMLPNGMIPGIVPSSGWGYSWGNGPVSEGVLFETAYRLYWHTGEKRFLTDSLPYFRRSLEFFETRRDPDGNISYGLDDWASPEGSSRVDAAFVNSALLVKFLRITVLACRLAGEDTEIWEKKLSDQIARHRRKYIGGDGTCLQDKQTAVAMTIDMGIYGDLAPLKAQLARLVEEKDFHHDCGMVGLPCLYSALNKCGLEEYAYRILKAKGFPGYRKWIDGGATTLWETWSGGGSHNHHMYSSFMSWMMKTVIGIEMTSTAYGTVDISPVLFDDLEWVSGGITTPSGGRISVEWKRGADGAHITISVPYGTTARFRDRDLGPGKYSFVIKE
ncbi:MAG: glycoside hydrolase family 78 protein [Clostridiales bacterium]|nr:glycoside hydrolase family 78 protein [Clostridiales bacterium]